MASKLPSRQLKWNLLVGLLLLWLLVASPAVSVEAAGARALLQSPDPGDCLVCTWTCETSVIIDNGESCCIECAPYPGIDAPPLDP